MFLGCNGSEHGALFRYIECSSVLILILLLFVEANRPKISLGRGKALAITWLLVTMLASSIVPDLLCNRQAALRMAFQSVLLITCLVLACRTTYRYISRS